MKRLRVISGLNVSKVNGIFFFFTPRTNRYSVINSAVGNKFIGRTTIYNEFGQRGYDGVVKTANLLFVIFTSVLWSLLNISVADFATGKFRIRSARKRKYSIGHEVLFSLLKHLWHRSWSVRISSRAAENPRYKSYDKRLKSDSSWHLWIL